MNMLTPFQSSLVLSVCPKGTRILSTYPHRKVQLPCPIWVDLVLPNGEQFKLIIRLNYIQGGVEKEAAVLPWLAKCGLLVPTVLAGPVTDSLQPEAGAMTILNVLPGKDFLTWGSTASRAQIQWSIGLILQGVTMMHSVTESLLHTPIASQLPYNTLRAELEAIIHTGGPWLKEPIFAHAIEGLMPIINLIQTQLAFSSGDYNQGNFLFDGKQLTGIIDFSGPCFEDPHIGMAMYWIHSWNPFDKAGIVERYLEQQELLLVDFAPRVALRCLRTLQERLPVDGGENIWDEWDFESLAQTRERLIRLLMSMMNIIGFSSLY